MIAISDIGKKRAEITPKTTLLTSKSATVDAGLRYVNFRSHNILEKLIAVVVNIKIGFLTSLSV